MRFVGNVMRRGKIEDLSLTGRIPSGCRAKGRQKEKYMDGIIRTVGGDGSKAVQILQMTRDRGKCGNPWSPTSAGARHCDKIRSFNKYSLPETYTSYCTNICYCSAFLYVRLAVSRYAHN